jgi:GT2 family glycosyltransferase
LAGAPSLQEALSAGAEATGEAIIAYSVESPMVSVIIVNWNGLHLLEKCLGSLAGQSLPSDEVIVIDNGSSDGSVDLVQTRFPHVRLLPLSHNAGFSRGNNLGIQRARGEYIVLLNNDAEPDPAWLGQLVAALEANPDVGFCSSKMMLYDEPGLADACGDFYTIEGVPGKIGHLEPADRHNDPREVFGACAGAAIYRRSVLEELGGFDEDFFIVHEDSDLSFRARLLGYKCLYVPTAVVYHHLGATLGRQSDTAVFYAQRNMEFVFFKNMPTVLLLKYLLLHVITDMFLFVRYLLHRQGQVFLRAKLDALVMMPKMLRKRREIQRDRRVSAAEIDRLLLKGYLWQKLRQGLRRSSRVPPLRGSGNRL